MVAGVLALLLSCSAKLAAGESYRLETDVYVFKQGDFRSIKLPSSAEADAGGSTVFRAPATLEFDQERLSLAGAKLSWSGGKNPPDRFSRIETPTVALAPGRPVSLVSSIPVQYLEKAADGNLRVREIPKDSPDAPHWRLTYSLKSAADAGDGVRLACDVDVAVVSGRENLSGVTLPVGKPVLARFDQKLHLSLQPNEWSAFVVRAPGESDYRLLTLVKLAPAEAGAGTAEADRLMTAKELAEFATYYYRNPQPELIGKAIESLGPSKFLDRGDVTSYFYRQSAYTSVGFFAAVFAANPDRAAKWKELSDEATGHGDPRSWLRKARRLSAPGTILALGVDHSSTLSGLEETWVFWGAFFASGNPAYLRKIIDRLSFVNEADQNLFDAGAEAMLLLAYNAPHHPLVRQTLEAVRKEAEPGTRSLIDDVLTLDAKAVLEEIRAKDHRSYSNIGDAENLLPWRRPFMPPPISGRVPDAETESDDDSANTPTAGPDSLKEAAPRDSSVRADRFMTAEEFAEFVTYYYQRPRSEQIARAIESLGPSGILGRGGILDARQYNHRAYTCVGFFAKIFADNPDRVPEWKKIIDRAGQNRETHDWLHEALELNTPRGKRVAATSTERHWGAFFASGDTGYLQMMVHRLEFLERENRSTFDLGAEAMLSLAYHAPHHPLVRRMLEAARKEAAPRKRELIDDLLNKDFAAVKQEVHDLTWDRIRDYPVNVESSGSLNPPGYRVDPGEILQRGYNLPR